MTDEDATRAANDHQALASSAFVEIVNALVEDFDASEVLFKVVMRSVQLLDAAAAGIMLVDATGNLCVIASSSDDAESFELFQVQNEMGPCVDCFATSAAISHGHLDRTTPWPEFARLSVEAGFLSVSAVPLRLKSTTIGCLNLFMRERGELDPADVALAQALADVATITIIQDRATRNAAIREDALQHALDSRIVIEQAKGIIAERLDVDMPTAFNRLRSHARNGGHRLDDIAADIVSGRLDIGAASRGSAPPPLPSRRAPLPDTARSQL